MYLFTLTYGGKTKEMESARASVPCAKERSTFLVVGSKIIVMKKIISFYRVGTTPKVFGGTHNNHFI